MKENKIPSAEEFLDDIRYVTYSTEEKLITFAKLHVKLALKAAIDNHEFEDWCDANGVFLKDESILNAYPEELIK